MSNLSPLPTFVSNKPTTTAKRRSKEYDYVATKYMKMLRDAEKSTSKAAELIGVTATTYTTCLQRGFANKPMELAAKGVYLTKHAPNESEMTSVTCVLPRAAATELLKWLKANGIKHSQC